MNRGLARKRMTLFCAALTLMATTALWGQRLPAQPMVTVYKSPT